MTVSFYTNLWNGLVLQLFRLGQELLDVLLGLGLEFQGTDLAVIADIKLFDGAAFYQEIV